VAPKWRRRVLVGAAVAVVLIVAVTAVASWFFSSALLVPEHEESDRNVEVEALSPGRVELSSNADSRRPGVYGLEWDDGRAIVGRIVAEDDERVTRELRDVRGPLSEGTKVAIDPEIWDGNPLTARGVPYERVLVRGELGPMPAWWVEGRCETWAIFVHGINADPQGGLRILPTLRSAGLHTLLITYRNDPGAPPSPDGLHHLGATEWRDLQAAARYALAHGARRLVLAGFSMGGAIVTQFMERSPLAARVAGLLLDSPALSWKPILSLAARERGLPSFAAIPVRWVVSARIDVSWDELDALQHSGDLRLPILLFHGTEDDVVPISTSADLAHELPRWVEFHRVPRAAHIASWNVKPGSYDRHLRSFVERLPDDPV
jgi:alpha-beta hydrolase superfamily lysophospholipase